MNSSRKYIDVACAMKILRDHNDDDYRPDSHFLMGRVCVHYADMLPRASQSTGSLIGRLKPGNSTFWATGTSAPCTGIFKPVWFAGNVLPDIGPVPEGMYNEQSLWWHHETLHRSVLLDYRTRIDAYKSDRDTLEDSFIKEAEAVEPENTFDLSRKAFSLGKEETENWIGKVRKTPIRKNPHFIYRYFWKKQNEKAGVIVA